MKDIDVLIVGGGPSGLMLSLELTAQNISFRIVDSNHARSDKSRALVLQPRTLELLNRHGIAQRFIDRGKLNMAVRIFANQRFVFENDFSSINFEDTMYHGPLMISQTEIESILDEELLKGAVKVERPVTAEEITQDNNGVTATLRHKDGSEETIRCKYVVGCDGAHSVVRKSSGLQFEGAAYPQDFILADLYMKWESKECLHVCIGTAGFLGIFPMKDNVWRLVVSRTQSSDLDAEPTLEEFQHTMNALIPNAPELFNPLSRRPLVPGWRRSSHSLAGGQGMNTGMHDAVNLGWKLASVIRSERDDTLLDSYNIERRRIGKILLHGTDRIFEFMSTTNPIYLFLRNYIAPLIIPWAMSVPGRRAMAYRFVSELGIRYRKSPIVGQATNWKGTLKAGDRMPDGQLLSGDVETTVHSLLGACNHTVFLFSGIGDQASNSDELRKAEILILYHSRSIRVHQIVVSTAKKTDIVDPEERVHRVCGLIAPAFVLVRPDGHIEFIGPITALDELLVWKEENKL